MCLIIQVLLIIQVFTIVAVFRDLIDQVLQTKVKDMTQQVTIIIETVRTTQNVRNPRQLKQKDTIMYYQAKQMLVLHFMRKMKK